MLSENVRMALASVRRARLRSFFTMLGVIIGVVSVITIVSLGEGVKRQIIGQSDQVGKDLITVRPGKLVNRDESGHITSANLLGGLGTSTLTDKDLASIRANQNIETVVPFRLISAVPIYNNQTQTDATIIATTSGLPSILGQKVEFGGFFNDNEDQKHTAIIGLGVAEKLFKEAIPIGKTVKIKDQDFIVSGVFEKFSENPTMPGINFNDTIFIPFGAGSAISTDGAQPIYEMLIKPKDPTKLNETVGQINQELTKSHSGKVDFTVLTQDELFSITGNVLGLISRMIIGMAAVSLFIGGIGIMNVMLVSVSERTREIGIRKAIGATKSQIRAQFMVEATVLSVWGVVIGVCTSVFVNFVLRIVTDLQPVITWQPVLYTSVISIAIGIIFGVIPAVKASRKDPIDALRPS